LILGVLTEALCFTPKASLHQIFNLAQEISCVFIKEIVSKKRAVFVVMLVFSTAEPRVVQTIDLPVLTNSVTLDQHERSQ
jgi:hypothetical protein